MKRVTLLAGLATVALAGALTARAESADGASPIVLPAAPGRDTLVRVCSTCHTPDIVAQQRLSRVGWAEVVETMANHGAVASDAELAEITDYLSAAFPDGGKSAAAMAK